MAWHLCRVAIHASARHRASWATRVIVLAGARLVRRRGLLICGIQGVAGLCLPLNFLRPTVLAARIRNLSQGLVGTWAGHVALASTLGKRLVGVGHHHTAGGQVDHQRHDGNQTYPPVRHEEHQIPRTRILGTDRHDPKSNINSTIIGCFEQSRLSFPVLSYGQLLPKTLKHQNSSNPPERAYPWGLG